MLRVAAFRLASWKSGTSTRLGVSMLATKVRGGSGSVIFLSEAVVPSEAPINSAVISKAGNSGPLVRDEFLVWVLGVRTI